MTDTGVTSDQQILAGATSDTHLLLEPRTTEEILEPHAINRYWSHTSEGGISCNHL